MDDFEPNPVRDDPLIRALSGDASSPLYGGSFREPSASDTPFDNVVSGKNNQNSSLAFLLAAIAFLGIALFYI